MSASIPSNRNAGMCMTEYCLILWLAKRPRYYYSLGKARQMKKNFTAFITFTLLSVTFLTAQSSLEGKVIEAESGEPVIFGNVAIYKNGVLITGTETDFDGNYSMSNIDFHAVRISERARAQIRPYKPKVKLIVVLGFVLGVMISVLFAFGKSSYENSMRKG